MVWHTINIMFTFTGNPRDHDRFRSSGNQHLLTNGGLQCFARPFSPQPPCPVSAKIIRFLSTIHAIDGMRAEGWQPVWVSGQTVRLDSLTNNGAKRHITSFRNSWSDGPTGIAISFHFHCPHSERNCAPAFRPERHNHPSGVMPHPVLCRM